MKNQCCFTDGIIRCGKEGDFRISENTRTDPDNFTDACEEHVGALLVTELIGEKTINCTVWTVEYIGEQKE